MVFSVDDIERLSKESPDLFKALERRRELEQVVGVPQRENNAARVLREYQEDTQKYEQDKAADRELVDAELARQKEKHEATERREEEREADRIQTAKELQELRGLPPEEQKQRIERAVAEGEKHKQFRVDGYKEEVEHIEKVWARKWDEERFKRELPQREGDVVRAEAAIANKTSFVSDFPDRDERDQLFQNWKEGYQQKQLDSLDSGKDGDAKLWKLIHARAEKAHEGHVWLDVRSDIRARRAMDQAPSYVTDRKEMEQAYNSYLGAQSEHIRVSEELAYERTCSAHLATGKSYESVDVYEQGGVDWSKDPCGENLLASRENAYLNSLSDAAREDALKKMGKVNGSRENMLAGLEKSIDWYKENRPGNQQRIMELKAEYDSTRSQFAAERWEEVAKCERQEYGNTASAKVGDERVAVARAAQATCEERQEDIRQGNIKPKQEKEPEKSVYDYVPNWVRRATGAAARVPQGPQQPDVKYARTYERAMPAHAVASQKDGLTAEERTKKQESNSAKSAATVSAGYDRKPQEQTPQRGTSEASKSVPPIPAQYDRKPQEQTPQRGTSEASKSVPPIPAKEPEEEQTRGFGR